MALSDYVSAALTIRTDMPDQALGAVRERNGRANLGIRENRIYAAAFPGVYDSATIDSANGLQAVLDQYPGYTIVLPDNCALAKSVQYDSNTHIVGRNKDKTNCYILPGFVGSSAFKPRPRASDSDYILRPKFENILFVDAGATASGRGSTSSVNGLDVTGTFGGEVVNLKGVRINALIAASPGPTGKHQWTRRLRMRGLDWSNVQYGFKFDPALDNRFAYGDFQLTDTESTGSCRYGCWAEDCDGFVVTGTVAFANGQLRLSGNALNIAAYHAFESRVALTDPANFTADGIFVSARAGGGRSTGVNMSSTLAFQTARLADTIQTIENPPPTINKGGVAIRVQNADAINICGMALDTSQQSMTLTGCTDILVSLTSLRANTQLLGSGALAPGTFDAVTLTNCQGAHINIVDQSPNKRYAVFADDACKGVHVTGVADFGGSSVPSQIRLPGNATCSFSILSGKADGSYVWHASHQPIISEVALTANSATPTGLLGRNGARGQFNSSVSTFVIDLPDLLAGHEAFLRIVDNGSTKIPSYDATTYPDSKFKLRAGGVLLGRGTCLRVFREPLTGFIVEV